MLGYVVAAWFTCSVVLGVLLRIVHPWDGVPDEGDEMLAAAIVLGGPLTLALWALIAVYRGIGKLVIGNREGRP